ncbi:oxidoreductase domain-containing protein [Vibrio nigripulchritudo ATCC 27043]|uniref:Oxidoreductase n=1 Tax=Vibrio nigripulchritudo SOn1 TaxID=1238450 RepID=A0AAV2VJ73_9VIBR|nr:Gfo/Idh/MocA family oxidoreductase [Vibrio nigripulchritudo]EGU61238.1 oxidoreductase domain-containing protein [Vibrio nigripulchritudo ATCC 27043]CCO44711.1 putative oxidoreductase [Vibrio nigripulchritudo SOn1]
MAIRYAIIGCGMMGQEHIRNIQLLPDASITAVYEPDGGMRDKIHQLNASIEFESSIENLLNRKDLDAILIASPNHCHADQLVQVIKSTALPILVEKPIITSLDDADRIRKAAHHHPAPIWVAMEYRYMPPITKLLDLVKENSTGKISQLSIREHRFPFLEKVGDWNRFNRNTGGTLVEKCCHFFDLMRLQTQSEAVRVYASGSQHTNHVEERYQSEAPDILDNAYVVVDFANGQRAMLELCMFAEGSRYQEEISVVGSSGKVEAFVPGPTRFWNTELGEPPTPKVVLSPRNPTGPAEMDIPVDPELLEAGDHNGSTFYQHQKFHQAITEGTKVEVTVEDGLKAVVIGLAAQASIEQGQVIHILDDGWSF